MTPDRQLPIFPLPLVLFPRCLVPLHLFEPRYRAMLADCLRGDREFGIVANAVGQDERAIPTGTVGCVAYIENVQQLPDGRSNILVSGRHRFALAELVEHVAPYLVALVRRVDDGGASLALLAPAAERVREVFLRVAEAARALHDDKAPIPDLPTDPAQLSFAIAHMLDMDVSRKQSLLTSRSPGERLSQLDALLTEMVGNIEERATVHQRGRHNGHGPVSSSAH